METVTFKNRSGKGAILDVDAIKRELSGEPWEDDPEDKDRQVRRVWLGTVFGLTPSGKVYAPFACSNVMGCDSCKGTGRILSRKERRHKKWANAWAKHVARRHMVAGQVYATRAKRDAKHAKYMNVLRQYEKSTRVCTACGGMGSREAFLDEEWNEYVEQVAEACDAYADWSDGDLFITQSRDREDEEEDEDADLQAG
jgi:hypothetical protein